MTAPLLLMTFDDRAVDTWFAHRGVLEDAGAHVTFFVSWADELTDEETDQLLLLQQHGHTVASHGLRHRDAPADVADHGLRAYLEREIVPSIQALHGRGLGHRDFAYPLGRHDDAVDDELLKHFSWLRATSPRHADARASQVLIDLDATGRRVLPSRGVDVGRRGVAHPDDRQTLLNLLDEAARSGLSVCLYAHDILEWDQGLARGTNFITPGQLHQVLQAATERGLSAVGTGVLPD